MEAYRVQLRVRSMNLRVGRGPTASVRRTSTETQYLIGSADDAFLCCRHAEIKPHHCWIVVHEQGVQARAADGSISVNDQPVNKVADLDSGDVVSAGPLQLEVYFHSTAEERRAIAEATSDPVEEKISDWLIEKDEAERQTRLRDSKSRHFKADELKAQETSSDDDKEKSASGRGAAKRATPDRKKPGKLPTRPPPGPTSKSSDAAAEGALKKIFTSWGGKKEAKGDESEKK